MRTDKPRTSYGANAAVTERSHGARTHCPRHLALELARTPEAPATARAAVRGWCDARRGRSSEERDTLLLLVSEVVTNAVLHSPGPAEAPIRFTASVAEEETVRVAVTDAGTGFTPRERDSSTTVGGYGLYLVQQEARRWGVDRVGGTRVWFEV